MQRHAVGIPLLRHLASSGADLTPRYLDNLLSSHAGYGKGFAANFDKLERDYVELRHFSAAAFFDDRSLIDHLGPIPDSFELRPNQEMPFEEIYLRRFQILRRWLDEEAEKITWDIAEGMMLAQGELQFGGAKLGTLLFDGTLEVQLTAKTKGLLAVLRDAQLPDVREAVALLALDYAELQNLGTPLRSPNAKFNRTVARLAKELLNDPSLSVEHQFSLLRKAAVDRVANPYGYPSEWAATENA
jgi:hypothetical protein